METWRRGRRRALVWQSAPVFSDLQDLRPYSADLLHTRAATVRPLRRERQMASPRGPRADDDDRHDYTMARDSWAKMLNKPFDDAARLLQPNVRGRAVRRRIALLRKARGRWLQRRVAAAFATWAEMSRQFGIAARMLARVCAQMLAAQLSRAWRKWVDAVGLDKRAQAIKRKVLARLCRGKWLAAAWRSWHLFVADARTRERLLDRVFRRLANRHLALGWRAWLEALNALRAAARLALLRRVAARLLDGALRLCAMAWRTWAAHLRMLKGSARLLDIARRLLERWAKAQLSRAFNALRVPRPRQPRQRRLGTLRLLDYDRGRPRRSEGPDPGLVAHMSTLETLLKQLRVMRLEENLGAARAAGRVSGWITPLPANQTLPPPTIPPHYYE
ncbi:hypothetical protein M885DRAFT_519319 [Pelagophyceae sp. CCMP2097]|nr:hypothetical protein M885DRAFT_519319 [Pelagophyceae sp. CCMP2097]